MNLVRRNQGNGIVHAGVDVVRREFRVVVLDDIAKRNPRVQEFENALHGDSRACHTRLPKMHLRVNR